MAVVVAQVEKQQPADLQDLGSNPTKSGRRKVWAVVVAQLVERSLPTPDVRGSNPDIGKVLSTNCTLEKTKIKKKRPGMAHLLKKSLKFLETLKFD